MVEQTSTEFTEDEAELYDRQIRLWGLDAQRRLRASRVLVVGASGLGAEVCKNVVLSGIKSLTLLDNAKVTEENSSSQFLVDSTLDIGKNLAECSLENLRQLNPMVDIVADSDDIDTKPDNFFVGFDVVVLINCSQATAVRLDGLCRRRGIKVFVAEVSGAFGYVFIDLGEQHDYIEEAQMTITKNDDGPPATKKFRPDTVTRKNVSFVSLENALSSEWPAIDLSSMKKSRIKQLLSTYVVMLVLNRFRAEVGRRPTRDDVDALLKIRDKVLADVGLQLPDDHVDDYIGYCTAELNPVCAIVGGVLSQEVIKAVTHKDRPHQNFFFFNGCFDGLGGVIENIS